MFVEQLNNCFLFSEPFSIAQIDVDNFEHLNDNFGHDQGDIALQTIASKLWEHLRRTDTAARLGGDEFAIILPITIVQVLGT